MNDAIKQYRRCSKCKADKPLDAVERDSGVGVNIESYEKWARARITHGHSIVRKKGVPKKKSPTGRAIPAVRERVPGVTSKVLLGKTAQNAMRCDEGDLERALLALRKSGEFICTNGIWWTK